MSTGQKIGAGAGLLLTGLSMGACDLLPSQREERQRPMTEAQVKQSIKNIVYNCLNNHTHGDRYINRPDFDPFNVTVRVTGLHESCINRDLQNKNVNKGFDVEYSFDKTFGEPRIEGGRVERVRVWSTLEERPDDARLISGPMGREVISLNDAQTRLRFAKNVTRQLPERRHFIGTDEHGMAKLFCCRDKHEGAKQYTGDGPAIGD